MSHQRTSLFCRCTSCNVKDKLRVHRCISCVLLRLFQTTARWTIICYKHVCKGSADCKHMVQPNGHYHASVRHSSQHSYDHRSMNNHVQHTTSGSDTQSHQACSLVRSNTSVLCVLVRFLFRCFSWSMGLYKAIFVSEHGPHSCMHYLWLGHACLQRQAGQHLSIWHRAC